ncbi:MAG: acyltransferase family protein [Candidatus Thorarchaeota archaeon]
MNNSGEYLPKKPRYLFLDNIKVLFTVLVIYWHVMVTYVPAGWWYYKEIMPVDPISYVFLLLLISIGGIFQTSLLGLFFLLGGYFTPTSYDRKGGYKFWKERLIRLGIPLLLYIALINPLMVYILSKLGVSPWSTAANLQGTFFDYYIIMFQSLDGIVNFFSFGGPMWFLRVLLLLTAVYTLCRQFMKYDFVQRRVSHELAIPRYVYLLLLAIALGILSFVVRIFLSIDDRPLEIPWGQLIQYLMMFSIGIICVRNRWFEKITKKDVQIWLITIIVSVLLIYLDFFFILGVEADLAVFSGGYNVHSLLFSIVDSIICMGVIFVLIKVFYAKFNSQGTLLRNVSGSAYNMYLVHPSILVILSVGIAVLDLNPIVKIGVVFPLAVLFCYLVSHYFIKKIRRTRHTAN